jgi:hypothetical protein
MQAHDTVDVYMVGRDWVGSGRFGFGVLGVGAGAGSEAGGEGFLRCSLWMCFFLMRARVFVDDILADFVSLGRTLKLRGDVMWWLENRDGIAVGDGIHIPSSSRISYALYSHAVSSLLCSRV